MDTITPDWTSLPQDLLASIAKRLHTRIDILRFRAVCHSFRCVLPRPPKVLLPESILKTADFLKGPNPDNEDPFVLTESTVYAIQPLYDETTRPLLVQVEATTSGEVRIKNPLSGFHYKDLPEESLNLLDFQVKGISKSYVFESAVLSDDDDDDDGNERESRESSVVAKLVFTPLDETDDGFALMAKFRDQELTVWRNVDKKWTKIDTAEIELPLEGLVDIVYRNHKWYTFTCRASTIIVDPRSLNVVEIAFPGDPERLLCLYLVESSNDLFLIAGYVFIKVRFVVFKLDEEKCQWIEVRDGLEDRVFFVGGRSSFSIQAEEFFGYEGNCIYFRSSFEKFYDDVDEQEDSDVLLSNLKDGYIENVCMYHDSPSLAWALEECSLLDLLQFQYE